MVINVLVGNQNAINEHGLSLLIQYKGEKILFDFGQSDLWIKNANALNIDLDSIEYLVLSHGHYDHGNGLIYANHGTLICHPMVFKKRFRRDGSYIGLAKNEEELSKKLNIIKSKNPYFLSKDICFLGEVNRSLSKHLLYDHSIDYLEDDSGLIINTEKGLVIFTGCGHSGILEIIKKGKEIYLNDKVYALIGGFHLKKISDFESGLLETLRKIPIIYTGHCTKDHVIEYLKEQDLPIHTLKTKMRIEI